MMKIGIQIKVNMILKTIMESMMMNLLLQLLLLLHLLLLLLQECQNKRITSLNYRVIYKIAKVFSCFATPFTLYVLIFLISLNSQLEILYSTF